MRFLLRASNRFRSPWTVCYLPIQPKYRYRVQRSPFVSHLPAAITRMPRHRTFRFGLYQVNWDNPSGGPRVPHGVRKCEVGIVTNNIAQKIEEMIFKRVRIDRTKIAQKLKGTNFKGVPAADLTRIAQMITETVSKEPPLRKKDFCIVDVQINRLGDRCPSLNRLELKPTPQIEKCLQCLELIKHHKIVGEVAFAIRGENFSKDGRYSNYTPHLPYPFYRLFRNITPLLGMREVTSPGETAKKDETSGSP